MIQPSFFVGIFMALCFSTGIAFAEKAQSAKESATKKPPVVLINLFTVPENKLKETLSMWEKARDFLQKQPGYISTSLHQSYSKEARYRLINIAKWKDAKAFQEAVQNMRSTGNIPPVEGVGIDPALYKVVRRD